MATSAVPAVPAGNCIEMFGGDRSVTTDLVGWWENIAVKDEGGHASLYAGNGSVTGKDKSPIDKMSMSRLKKKVATKDGRIDQRSCSARLAVKFPAHRPTSAL